MVDLNCDMGEGFGIYSFADDEEIMPFIDAANVACGFHASDPNTMSKTVELAKKFNSQSRFSSSLSWFGWIWQKTYENETWRYQKSGYLPDRCLKSFFRWIWHALLNHIKPHGSLYGVSAIEEEVAHGIADAAEIFNVGVFGMVNTCHEKFTKKEE